MLKKVLLLVGGVFCFFFLFITLIGVFSNPVHFNKKTIIINRSPSQVWHYLTDVSSIPKYRKEIRRVTLLAPTLTGHFRYQQETYRGRISIIEVNKSIENKALCLVLVSSNTPLRVTWNYELNPTLNGTLLTLSQNIHVTSFWMNAILGFIGKNSLVEQELKVIQKTIPSS